jgi:hypothetical protein
MAKQIVMDHTGHSEHVFDRASVVSMQEAERRFKELTGSGFTAGERTGPGEFKKVSTFDPAAEETVFVPPLVGG